MKEYIGIKRIKAEPMTRGDYNKYRGWQIPKNENPADEGYLVVYEGVYESWSPKKVFEEAYHESGKMSFSEALYALKRGASIARSGWNGKGMFLFLANGKDLTNCICTKDMPPCVDSVCMKTAQNTIVVGWLASQTDMLACDWCIVE